MPTSPDTPFCLHNGSIVSWSGNARTFPKTARGHSCTLELYLKQCVIDVFCSTSTERSRKSSSLLLIYKEKKNRQNHEVAFSDYVIHHEVFLYNVSFIFTQRQTWQLSSFCLETTKTTTTKKTIFKIFCLANMSIPVCWCIELAYCA